MNSPSGSSLLSRYSAEFASHSMEDAFQQQTWQNSKKTARNVMLVVFFFLISFIIRDFLETNNQTRVFLLLVVRLSAAAFVLYTIIRINRTPIFFNGFFHLLLLDQVLITLTIFLLAVIRTMPIAYLGVNIILFTLISYQFLSNRFIYTVSVCVFAGLGALATGIVFLGMNASDFTASVLFLIPLNILGVWILRSNNRIRRNQFIAQNDLEQANREKEKVISDLQAALAEVKTLRNFLPICARCKKIRDDEGYWNRVDVYLKKHADVEFSHGLCPDCTKELYGQQKWFKKSGLAKKLEKT